MKKVLIILLFVFITMCSCVENDKIEIGDSIWKLYEKYEYSFRDTFVVTFDMEDGYVVVITDFDNVVKKANFTLERKGYNAKRLSLIENINANEYIGLSIDEVERRLGKIHVDNGSGFYIPSYITEDGYLLSFILDNEVICGYIKYDLLNTTTPDETVYADDYLN